MDFAKLDRQMTFLFKLKQTLTFADFSYGVHNGVNYSTVKRYYTIILFWFKGHLAMSAVQCVI